MRKFLIVAALLVGSTGMVSGQPNHAADEERHDAKQSQPSIVPPDGKDKQASGQANQPKPNGNPPARNAPIERPHWWADSNWWLVLIAGLTGGMIGWQSWETRKASEAARDGIRIQEAGVRQWVNVVPIGLDIRNKLEDSPIAVLKFEIVNRTDFPLTILGTDIEVIANIHTPETFVTDCRHSLVPQKTDGDSTYPFFMEIATTMDDWSSEGRIFIVAGDIKFLDCMGIERTQTIQDLYRGFLSGSLERMKPAGITTSPQDAKDSEQPPNPN